MIASDAAPVASNGAAPRSVLPFQKEMVPVAGFRLANDLIVADSVTVWPSPTVAGVAVNVMLFVP